MECVKHKVCYILLLLRFLSLSQWYTLYSYCIVLNIYIQFKVNIELPKRTNTNLINLSYMYMYSKQGQLTISLHPHEMKVETKLASNINMKHTFNSCGRWNMLVVKWCASTHFSQYSIWGPHCWQITTAVWSHMLQLLLISKTLLSTRASCSCFLIPDHASDSLLWRWS